MLVVRVAWVAPMLPRCIIAFPDVAFVIQIAHGKEK
jgi:hypothetical protein